LTEQAAGRALRHLRKLLGTPVLALYDGTRLLAWEGPGEVHAPAGLAAARRAMEAGRPVVLPAADLDCGNPECPARRLVGGPLPGGRPGRGRRPRAVRRPGPGRAGDRPLGQHPARAGRAGRVAGQAGPGRGEGAAGPDQPALHLQRADHHRLVRTDRPGAGPRAGAGVRRVHPVQLPGASRVHHPRRGTAQHRPVPDAGAGPVRRPAGGPAAGRPGGVADRGAVPGVATAGGERGPARPGRQARGGHHLDRGRGCRHRVPDQRGGRRRGDGSGGAAAAYRGRRARRAGQRGRPAPLGVRRRLRPGGGDGTGGRYQGHGADPEVPGRGASLMSAGMLRALAVDDEPPALDELAYLLRAADQVASVTTAGDATQALRALRDAEVDVVFLDIRMPGLDGLELARVLGRFARPPAVVFVTAHDDRAVDASALGAVAYLLKPVRPDRLAETLRRVLAARQGSPRPAPRAQPADEVIPVELAGRTRMVPRSAVRWVEAQGDYARLHTADGSHLVRVPLAVLEERWADAGFVRIHRSYLVALRLISELRLTQGGYLVP